MKNNQIFIITCIALLFCSVTGFASADLTQSLAPITGKVFVSSTTYYPEVFFTGDKGTVTFDVMNSNTNTSVMLNHGAFSDPDIRLLSNTYDFSNPLGPLQTRPFTFSIVANAPPGDYYPTFSLSFFDSNLYHKTLVQVDNTPLELTLLDKPDTFAQGNKKTIYMQVSNPRKNNVRNVVLEVSGNGTGATPSRSFVGDLSAGASVPVNFTVTPDQPTTAILRVNYDNGDNPHSVTMEIPITFGVDKTQAHPVMSNVQVTSVAGIYHVTGDVNNAGLQTAYTMMVTSLPPAVPQDPYKNYVVGALKSDDFGSFEVTFSTGNATTVPIQLSFKDADGNVYTSVQEVKVSASGQNGSPATTGSNMLPVIIGIVIVILFVGGWILYVRRNKK
jgi:hypothetical protein